MDPVFLGFFLRNSGIGGFNLLSDFVIAIALFFQSLPFIPQIVPTGIDISGN